LKKKGEGKTEKRKRGYHNYTQGKRKENQLKKTEGKGKKTRGCPETISSRGPAVL